MKKFIAIHMLLLTLLVVTVSGCAPMLLAGGAAVGIKGTVTDAEHTTKLKEHTLIIDSNLMEVNRNKTDIDTLHEKIEMLENKIINLERLFHIKL